jgi:hypothetical protein
MADQLLNRAVLAPQLELFLFLSSTADFKSAMHHHDRRRINQKCLSVEVSSRMDCKFVIFLERVGGCPK